MVSVSTTWYTEPANQVNRDTLFFFEDPGVVWKQDNQSLSECFFVWMWWQGCTFATRSCLAAVHFSIFPLFLPLHELVVTFCHWVLKLHLRLSEASWVFATSVSHTVSVTGVCVKGFKGEVHSCKCLWLSPPTLPTIVSLVVFPAIVSRRGAR